MGSHSEAGAVFIESKKSGPNKRTKKGFNASGTTGFGELDLTYKFKKSILSGTGKTPACAADLVGTFLKITNGVLTEKKMSGTIDITFIMGVATSTFSAKKKSRDKTQAYAARIANSRSRSG